MMIQHDDVKITDLTKLKVVIVASATTDALIGSGEKYGIDLISSYGMSESCPIISFSFLNQHELSSDKKEQYPLRTNVGKPVPFMDVRIIDETGDNVITPNHIGEIVLRSPWLTKGYNKEETMSEELWLGGWLHTNDIGFVDQNNRITLVDRKRDMIKSGGEWIAPSEIEGFMGKHPNVKAVAVFGIDDEKWGERPVAAIILKEQGTPVSELLKFLERFISDGKLNKISMVDHIKLFEEFPATGTGKIDKKKLKEIWLNLEQ
jgi:fatty-acyl-CoA synthase